MRRHTKSEALTKTDKESGFTLVEILAVLVIIGLISGIVAFNLPSPKTATQTQAETLTRQLNALSQNGLISGEIQAFGVSEKGYSLYRYDGERFTSVATMDWTENVKIALRRNDTKTKVPEEISPQILFEPTQISTPFILDLSGPRARFELQSKGDGRVVMVKTE